MKNSRTAQSGNVVVYLLVALLLAGVLISTLAKDSGRSPEAIQADELQAYIESDLKTIEAAVTDCVLVYPAPVDFDESGTIDADDNPNPPFPVYGEAPPNHIGPDGDAITDILCPAAPVAKQKIFNNTPGRQLKVLGDASKYTVTYINDDTEGVMIRILHTNTTQAPDQTLFYEAVRRIDAKLSACKAELRMDGWGGTDAACTAEDTACLVYWIKALSTNSSEEAGCGS